MAKTAASWYISNLDIYFQYQTVCDGVALENKTLFMAFE